MYTCKTVWYINNQKREKCYSNVRRARRLIEWLEVYQIGRREKGGMASSQSEADIKRNKKQGKNKRENREFLDGKGSKTELSKV